MLENLQETKVVKLALGQDLEEGDAVVQAAGWTGFSFCTPDDI